MHLPQITLPWVESAPRPSAQANAPFAPRISALVADGWVSTAEGRKQVFDLVPGDELHMPGHGKAIVQALRARVFSAADLQDHPDQRPIRIDAEALAPGFPRCATLAAPGQPIARRDHPGCTPFPGLARAYALCNGGSIRPVIPEDGITYIEVICVPLAQDGSLAT
ncbi:Hint domain-containing protein [Gymnodinialimonas sp. 2305UL16-5]|uniref:Hint domain-containing protein n=1 Tax=Gymnodinialimonas mytili TaxID=3126503 RepID=UPI00309D87AA